MNITKSMIVLMVIFFQQAIHAQEVALECSTFFRISENEIDYKIGNLSSHNLIYDKKTKRLTYYQATFLRSADIENHELNIEDISIVDEIDHSLNTKHCSDEEVFVDKFIYRLFRPVDDEVESFNFPMSYSFLIFTKSCLKEGKMITHDLPQKAIIYHYDDEGTIYEMSICGPR